MDIVSFLTALSEQPLIIALAIILATFILEDAATIGAALLSIDGMISPWLALAALYIGISLGDMGLYGLGRLAAINEKVRARIGEVKLRAGRRWLRRRLAVALFGARFMPGMRLPTYVTTGFLRIPFEKFTLYAVVAATVWTTAFFSIVFFFGHVVGEFIGSWVWVIGAVLIGGLIVHNVLLARKAHQRRVRRAARG